MLFDLTLTITKWECENIVHIFHFFIYGISQEK